MDKYIDFAWADSYQAWLDLDYTPENGINRYGYSSDEDAAIDKIIEQVDALQKAGYNIRCYSDLMGNIYIVKPGANPETPAILFGSHLDSVPRGGRFDGSDGTIAAMACLSGLAKAGIELNNDLVCTIWRCEESPLFKQVSVGAKGSMGDFSKNKLESLEAHAPHPLDGFKLPFILSQTLQHLLEKGFITDDSSTDGLNSFSAIANQLVNNLLDKNGSALLDKKTIKQVIEMHIEQGEHIANAGADVGAVNAIRGNVRHPDVTFSNDYYIDEEPYKNAFEFDMIFHGKANHSGSTPQDEREDAIARAMSYICNLETQLKTTTSDDFAIQLDTLEQKNGSPTTIPSHIHLQFTVGSDDPDLKLDDIYPHAAPGIEINQIGPVIPPNPLKNSYNFLAAARFLTGLNQQHRHTQATQHDIVWTAPLLYTDNENNVHLALEVRSTNQDILEQEGKDKGPEQPNTIQKVWQRIAESDIPVTADFTRYTISQPTQLKPAPLIMAAKKTGVEAIEMISGAGHDCAVFAAKRIPTLLLFIRQEIGLSHDPAEWREPEDFKIATRVIMQHLLAHKASEKRENTQLSIFERELVARGALTRM